MRSPKGTWRTSVRDVAETGLAGWTVDAVVSILSVGFLAGVLFDFRAHHSGISFAEEGFFTPSHVFFYSMVLGIAAVIGGVTYRHRRAGASWTQAVPAGYRWGVLGLYLFGLGGLGDFLWHSTFGYEHGTEGLASPPHLVLATGAVLFLASPLRAARHRADRPTWLHVLPVVLSASAVFSLLALFGGWVNPLSQPRPAPAQASHASRMIGICGLLLFSLFFVGGMQALARRFRLPFGALTVVIAVPAIATAVVWGTFVYVPAVVVTGLAADGFVRWRRPTATDVSALRAFGGLVPMVFVGSYMAVVEFTEGIAWTVHLWTGAVVLAGLVGLLLTFAIVPGAPDGA